MRTTLTTTEILTALAAGQLSSDAAAELMAAATELTVPASAVAVGRVTVKELRARCKTAGIRGYSKMEKAELLDALAAAPKTESGEPIPADSRTVKELRAACKAAGHRGYSSLKRAELLSMLSHPAPAPSRAGETVEVLRRRCKEAGIAGYSRLKKAELQAALAVHAHRQAASGGASPSLAVAASAEK